MYLADVPHVAAALGGRPSDWRVGEVGDGNLNLVFIVRGPLASVVVKQALPYVRLVGEAWPLSLRRAFFEHRALVAQRAAAPAHVPEVLHFDEEMALTVMAHLQPHVILRKGLVRGVIYPHLADHASTFLARTLFATSDLGQSAAAKKRDMAVFCDNVELCRITEDLVFTDPWRMSAANRWTTPQLDATAAAVRADGPWKRAAQELELVFLSRAEAMIHGDLHSGSIMVTETETFAIDPEFAFYGPMGFDVGALIGNLYLAYFAQRGHEGPGPARRDAYRAWILDTAEATWTMFAAKFRGLWDGAHAGPVLAPALFAGQRDDLVRAQDAYLRRLFADALGFAGTKMTRRILGLAHVEDLESIADANLRAECETRALGLARALMVDTASFPTIAGGVRSGAGVGARGVVNVDGTPYRTIWLAADGETVRVIDQTRLPHAFVVRDLTSLADAERAIRDMVVRGAPLLGAAAAYGVALAMAEDPSDATLARAHAALLATRPTAVNLRWALDDQRALLSRLPPSGRRDAAYRRAAAICDEDVENCRRIGAHGLGEIRRIATTKPAGPIHALTHCNAGWLAAVDGGTALAPIYHAHDAGIPIHVWVGETRPRNQGASLTAWELARHGVPHTVIADNAGGHLMQSGARGPVASWAPIGPRGAATCATRSART